MATDELLIGIGLGNHTASAAYLLPGKNVDATLVDGYPGAENFRTSVVSFRLQYAADREVTVAWGRCSESRIAVKENILLRTGKDAFHLKSDGDVIEMLSRRYGEMAMPISPAHDPISSLRGLLDSLMTHIKRRAEVKFGTMKGARFKVAISVPPWWYGLVSASELSLLSLEPEPRPQVLLLPEPISCLTYFLSRNKKHRLTTGGLVCHCSMDESFTTITQVLVSEDRPSLRARLREVEIQNFSVTDVSNAVCELIEERIETSLGTIDNNEVVEFHNELRGVAEHFVEFLPRFDGTKDYTVRLPWQFPDYPASHIRNNQIVIDASTLRERIFKTLLISISKSLTRVARGENSKLYVLCSGALSTCPYVPLCLTQLLSEQSRGEEIEVLKAVNGRTSASSGAAVFLDKNRRQSQLGTIDPLLDEAQVIVNQDSRSRSAVLAQRLSEISSALPHAGEEATGNGSARNKAVLLERRAKILLHEHLERFAFSPSQSDLFASIHSLHVLLGRRTASADLRRQFDEVVREKHGLDIAQNLDLIFWFCKAGASSGVLDFLLDTGSSLNTAASFDSNVRVYPIHIAAKYNQLAVLGWLLKNGAYIGAKTNDGSTCLHLAIRSLAERSTPESRLIVGFIIRKFYRAAPFQEENPLNIQDDSGSTALDLAVDRGLGGVAETLRGAGAEHNSRTRFRRANLMEAIEVDDGPALQKLLDTPLDRDQHLGFPDGASLLHLAAMNQSYRSVEVLLGQENVSRITEINVQCSGGWTALHLAVELGHLAMTALLIQKGADVEASSDEDHGWANINKDLPFGSRGSVSFMRSKCPTGIRSGRWRPLHIAAVYGNEPIAMLLLESGASPQSKDFEGLTAVQRAVISGHEQVVGCILDHEANAPTATIQDIQTPFQSLSMETATAESDTKTNADAVSQDSLEQHQSSIEGRNALHDAVEVGNLTMVEMLLRHGYNPNCQEPTKGWSPLTCAVVKGDTSLTSILLSHRADPGLIHADGSGLLHLAAAGKTPLVVRTLLPLCPVTTRDRRGQTPLHYASGQGFSPTAIILLQGGAEIDARDSAGRTPLYVAITKSNLPVSKSLVDYGAKPDIVDGLGRTLLHAAASSGSLSALDLVVSRQQLHHLPLDVADAHGHTPLGIAAEAGHANMTRALLQLHRPRNLWRPIISVLFAAVVAGNVQALDAILGHDNIFVNAFGGDTRTAEIVSVNGVSTLSKASWTPLHAAAWAGQHSTVEFLLGRNALVNVEAEFSLTPLGLVTVTPPGQLRPQHLRIAELLIDRGGNILKGGFGDTSLQLAALSRSYDMVSLLLSRGAPVDLVNWEGQSALDFALRGGSFLVASKLIEYGADVKRLVRGLPLLHRAVLGGSLDMVKLLVAAGVDVNFVAPDGTTALLAASLAGRTDVVRYLLANGSDLDRRTGTESLSALDAAVTNGHLGTVKEILGYIESHKRAHPDWTYAWVAAAKSALLQPKICEYIYERTNCQRDQGAGILHWAVSKGHMALLEFLVSLGVDLKTPNSGGWSALHCAAMADNIPIARAIINTGFDVNYAGHASRTALHQAVAADQPGAVAFLLANGADPNLRDEDSQLPVHIAIDYGAIAALRALPLTAENFTMSDFDGKTLVGLACASGDSALLTTLLATERTLGPGHRCSLHQAVSDGDTLLIRKLLDHGADVEARDSKGRSLLRHAVKQRNREVTSILVERGAELESKCELGTTPLSSAAKHNDLEMASLLINHGADVNSRENKSEGPILVAVAYRGHLDMVELLINAGCDIRYQASNGNTAMHETIRKGHTAVAVRLVQAGFPVDHVGNGGESLVFYAYRFRQYSTAAALVGLGADVTRLTDDRTAPLHKVVQQDNAEAVDLLLDHGADINCVDSKGRTPIMLAAAKSAESAFRRLRDRGADVNAVSQNSGMTVLHFAAHGGCVRVAEILVSDGIDLNTRETKIGYTPLLRAARTGRLEFIRYLAKEGADLEATSKTGTDAVLVACEFGQVEAVRLLVELGLGCDQARNSGHTPLMIAAESGNFELVTMLVEHGARIDIVARNGWGPLHTAVSKNRVDIIRFLLQHGANPVLAGTGNKTPLHVAAEEGHWLAAEALLERSPHSDVDGYDNESETPIIIAARKGNIEFIRRLIDHRAHLAVPSLQWDIAAAKAAENNHLETVEFFIHRREAMTWLEQTI